jgi:hypothetical protein
MTPPYETRAASGADRGSETLAAGSSDASVFKPSDPDLQRPAGIWLCAKFQPSAMRARLLADHASFGGGER